MKITTTRPLMRKKTDEIKQTTLNFPHKNVQSYQHIKKRPIPLEDIEKL